MMGFEVDFGHKHAADLIPSERFDEKQVGYQALTILLNEVRACHCRRPCLHASPLPARRSLPRKGSRLV